MDNSMEFWHGGRRWEGSPEVMAPAQGRYECGPGLYLTTSYATASKYAKGPKVLTRVVLPAYESIHWLEDTVLPLEELVAIATRIPRLKCRDAIIGDLRKASVCSGKGMLPVETLLNLGVNYEALAGKAGLAFVAELVQLGIDASRYNRNGQEDWVIVFNPAIIRKHSVPVRKDIPLTDWELPLLKTYKETI